MMHAILFSALWTVLPCSHFFKVSSENDIFLNAELNIFVPNLLEGIREYLFMDFHALMNNEIFYSYQPAYLRNCSGMLDETELREIDELAGLLQNPDENMEEIEKIWYDKNKFTILTNNTQNIYCDVFEKE